MGKGAPEGHHGGFPFLVVVFTEDVGLLVVKQVPGLIGESLGGLGFVELGDPIGKFVVVKLAGGEFSGGFGKPEGFAGVPGHRDRTAVLHRHPEDFGLAVGVEGDFVAEG